MVSPVPKHLVYDADAPEKWLHHVSDLSVNPANGVKVPNAGRHRAKYAPGLASALLELAGTKSVGDPMAGTGTLAYEAGMPIALNDLNEDMRQFLDPLSAMGCEVSYGPASDIKWKRDCCIFSPPYYPRTDRKKPNAHNDAKRGPVVGFRDKYDCNHPEFIGNPGGVNAILTYRGQMTAVYSALLDVCDKMIVVTKNWMRLGVELRLDLDTINMCQNVGWQLTARHGFTPPQSLWARYNAGRGERQGVVGMVTIEDVLVFEKQT